MNSLSRPLAKSPAMLIAFLGLALTAACATSPQDIAPKYTSGDQYRGWSCERILAERTRVVADLSSATAKQEETRSDDIAGVIFLALPVGSMSGEDQEPMIARLKGERDALNRIT